jgi:L-fucose dehydrogenase
MDLRLHGKVALITGGAAGIGEAVVRLFCAEGSKAVIADKNVPAGERLARELENGGASVFFIPADLTRETDCERAVRETIRVFGKLDVLVNNAGVNDSVGLDHSPAEFLESLRRNLFHVFAVTHFAAESLKSVRGAVINISSKVAVTGQGHTSGYAAAKGGVNALTREWAIALAPFGVRVNCVVPAECLTPQYENWFRSQPDPTAAQAGIENLIPLGKRMTAPEEIAASVVFLASERSSHTTGQILFVDGGYSHLDRAFSHAGGKWG